MVVNGVRLMKGSQARELMESKEKDAPKKLKQLMEFCKKCEEANYDYSKVQELRAKYCS